MTREEFERERRIYRKMWACFKHPSWVGGENEDPVNSEVFERIFDAIFYRFPPEVRLAFKEPRIRCHSPRNAKFNLRYLPNSYPHKTRNP